MSEQWYCPNCGPDSKLAPREPEYPESWKSWKRCAKCYEALLIETPPPFVTDLLARAEKAESDIDAMVSRFLCWKLPRDFAPDGRISFDRKFLVFDGFDGAKRIDIFEAPEHYWPTGTNLFTAEQAKAMIEHMFGIEHD